MKTKKEVKKKPKPKKKALKKEPLISQVQRVVVNVGDQKPKTRARRARAPKKAPVRPQVMPVYTPVYQSQQQPQNPPYNLDDIRTLFKSREITNQKPQEEILKDVVEQTRPPEPDETAQAILRGQQRAEAEAIYQDQYDDIDSTIVSNSVISPSKVKYIDNEGKTIRSDQSYQTTGELFREQQEQLGLDYNEPVINRRPQYLYTDPQLKSQLQKEDEQLYQRFYGAGQPTELTRYFRPPPPVYIENPELRRQNEELKEGLYQKQLTLQDVVRRAPQTEAELEEKIVGPPEEDESVLTKIGQLPKPTTEAQVEDEVLLPDKNLTALEQAEEALEEIEEAQTPAQERLEATKALKERGLQNKTELKRLIEFYNKQTTEPILTSGGLGIGKRKKTKPLLKELEEKVDIQQLKQQFLIQSGGGKKPFIEV